MKITLRRILATALLAIALTPLAIIAYQKILKAGGNFHPVVAGEFYRSAQLSSSAFQTYVDKYGIKTVINLRGESSDKQWYRDQKRIADEMGVDMVDFSMSATKPLTTERAQKLVAIMRSARKPILVHCMDGADRTGLASVIYASQVAGMSEEDAEKHLSVYYGHFGIPLFSPTYAMDQSWKALERNFASNEP